MSRRAKVWLAIALVVGLGAAAAIFVAATRRLKPPPPLSVTGVVLADDTDPRKQVPIAGAIVTGASGVATAQARTDATGLFTLALNGGGTRSGAITLSVQHPDYQPMQKTSAPGGRLYVLRLVSTRKVAEPLRSAPEKLLSDVRVRYTEKQSSTQNIGSIVKAFEIVNTGDIPCEGRQPCSPDGNWKATIGSVTLSAGPNWSFRNIRLSCIAGPCPFTKMESETRSSNGEMLTVSVRNWSDTATYLLEAEATQMRMVDIVRISYPAKFGVTMNFTLPPAAEGPSILADLDGHEIVYPLGPDLLLSWAVCSVNNGTDGARLYRCDLKPGYGFKENGANATP